MLLPAGLAPLRLKRWLICIQTYCHQSEFSAMIQSYANTSSLFCRAGAQRCTIIYCNFFIFSDYKYLVCCNRFVSGFSVYSVFVGYCPQAGRAFTFPVMKSKQKSSMLLPAGLAPLRLKLWLICIRTYCHQSDFSA